jgi:hypothetical protein
VSEPPVEYADGRRGSLEAARSLASHLGVSEVRAAAMLADGTAAAEIRCHAREAMTPRERLRSLERRYAAPWMSA